MRSPAVKGNGSLPQLTQEARDVMNETSGRTRCGHESGFALILAILSLMLLTFLGLTLATSSSTELQIATNYRWSQQALYNAEAGMEHAKWLLATNANAVTMWQPFLPAVRPGPWVAGAAPAPPAGASPRDFESRGCDLRGGNPGAGTGMGYGQVLTIAGTTYQDVNNIAAGALQINGAYTIWVRRELNVNADGTFQDDPANTNVVLTVEGVAPYVATQGAANSFARAAQAVRVLEQTFTLTTNAAGNPCGGFGGQKGLGPTGDNFDNCTSASGDTYRDSFVGQAGMVGATGSFGNQTSSGGGVVQ
jgi:hypothetical protein